jgi:hypothetical protein
MLSPLTLSGRILLLAGLLALAPCGHAAGPAALRPFLEEHCLDCHDADEKKGGLNLDALDFNAAEATHAKWVRIFDRVLAGEMPPPKRSRPDATQQRAFLTTLGQDLVQQHTAAKGTVLRRLNRREYENTIHDLLGVNVEVRSLLPEDGIDHGFDTIGDALGISAIQMQRYLEAAEVALNAALLTDARPESKKERHTYDTPNNQGNIDAQWLRREDGAIVFFNDGGFPSTVLRSFTAKTAGDYRVRITGYGYQSDAPVPFAIIVGAFNRGGTNTVHSFHELPTGAPSTVELTLRLQPGDNLKLSPQRLSGPEGTSPRKNGAANYRGEGLAVQHVEIEGPLIEQWPPRGRTLLLGDLKVRELPPEKPWMRGKAGFKPVFSAESAEPAADARRLLPGFLAQAFRRPITAGDVAPYLELFEAEYAQGQDFLVAMRTAAIAALCSPDFLYLREPAGRLDDHALAARLSYFLTRTAPDAELRKLAAAKQLTQPAVLRAQTERLLRGAGLDRFVADFTDGWLNLREIDFTTPDRQLYPEFDEMLQDAMLRETRGFIRELLVSNLSVANLIQSDFAMLNARLAEHYGLPGVRGLAMQKVKLPPESRRGGLLTHGSILKVSANGTSTSPVIRGVWVTERLLGLTPAPPPPGTPGVEPDIRGAKTVREILAAHRSMESCHGCHRVIDPPGFALESYDVIGGWRDRFRSLGEGQPVSVKVEGRKVRYKLGPPVDAAGELPGGEKFEDFAGFQKHLLASQDRVAKCVTEKLLTFATGRAMGFSDRTEIDRLIAASKARQHTMRDLLHAVVQSEIFLRK